MRTVVKRIHRAGYWMLDAGCWIPGPAPAKERTTLYWLLKKMGKSTSQRGRCVNEVLISLKRLATNGFDQRNDRGPGLLRLKA